MLTGEEGGGEKKGYSGEEGVGEPEAVGGEVREEEEV